MRQMSNAGSDPSALPDMLLSQPPMSGGVGTTAGAQQQQQQQQNLMTQGQFVGPAASGFVSPSMWQASVASVYEGGLKRGWGYDLGGMEGGGGRV